MNKLKNLWPYFLILIVVLIFFLPVFKGKIPFPGDLLINENPYKTESFLGYAPSGYPNKAQGPDVIKEIYPWRHFSINQLKQGSIPFWNPYNFSGNPQMANFQTAVFYPLNFLYFLLPFNISWTLIVMFQPLLAGFFMYLFLKKGVGLKDFSSFIGAISFAFSSYMTVWIEYGNIGNTLLWLPLALLSTKYFFQKLTKGNFLLLSITLSMSILAGYIQGVFYIYALCFFYYNYLVFSTKNAFKNHKKNFIFLLSLFIPFLITSFQILPTLQLFSESTRGAYTLSQIEKNLAPVFNLVTIAFPDFFGNPATRNYWIDGTYIERVMYPGSVILFFVFYAILGSVKFLEKRFFIIVSLISLIVATNLPFIKYFYLIPIPVISTTVATREFSIFIFSLIVLGSIGLDYFITDKTFRLKILSLYAGFFVFVWTVVFLFSKIFVDYSSKLKITERNLIIPTILAGLIIFSVLIKQKKIKLSFLLITLIVVFDLFYFFNKITPFAPSTFTYPKTPVVSFIQNNAGINRFWGYGSAYILPNFQSVDKTYSPEGNDPLHIASYGQLLATSNNGKLPLALPRPDANIASGYGSSDLKNNVYRQRLLNLLGVKYLLNQDYALLNDYSPDLTTFPESTYKLIWQKTPWQVYENKNVLPRYFIANKYIVVDNKSEALALIYDSKTNLRKTLILENDPDIKIDENAKGEVSLLLYKPNRIVFNVNSSGNSLLFLSDNYYKDWKVSIDKKPAEILLADYSFRAVAIPKGEHKVEFYYDSKNFKFGLFISVLGVIILLTVLYYVKNNKEKN